MRHIAVINQKGGVGKTTTSANLGAALAKQGAKVLLIDLDPQGHLSLHFDVELADGQRTIYDVLTSATPVRDVIVKIDEHVSVLPADIDLAGAEAELVSVMGREVLLREALEPVRDSFDIVLIDCPPSLGVLTINALVAATEVIIPLQAHFLALQGLSRLLDTVTLVRQRINPKLSVSGIVLCMHESATRLAGEVVDDLTNFLDGSRNADVPWSAAKLYETRIRRNIKLAESCSFGQTVFEYAPRSNGAIDYFNLAAEVLGKPVCSTSVSDATPPQLKLPVVAKTATAKTPPAPTPHPTPTEKTAKAVEQPSRGKSVTRTTAPVAETAAVATPKHAARRPATAPKTVPAPRRTATSRAKPTTNGTPAATSKPTVKPAPITTSERPTRRKPSAPRVESIQPEPPKPVPVSKPATPSKDVAKVEVTRPTTPTPQAPTPAGTADAR